ncbi:hypothetical protein AB0A91_29280 [Streptomyces sp. NPDC042207]|uniref:hypothetical protein n=1 Tax=Streptomyces sp. NPDC042207 TaxID=3154331 RepID=UPI0033E9FBF3
MPVNVWGLDGLDLAGRDARLADAAMVMAGSTAGGVRAGVRPGDSGLAVTLAGSTINVGAGLAVLGYSGQGAYRVALPATVSPGTLQAAHASLSRIDLVYLRVWDNAVDGAGMAKGDPVYLPGTASATPAAPTPTGNLVYIPLATITVPPVGGGSPSVSMAVRPVTVAPGGILPSTTAPPNPYIGQCWDDGTNVRRWNGSTWDTLQKVETVAWTTPTLGTGYTRGNATEGNGNGPIRYRTYTDRGTPYMEWDGGATRAVGAQVVNILSAALPTALRPQYRASFAIPRNAASITGTANSTSVFSTLKVDFNTDGTIALITATAGSTETTWLSLRGIRYPLS